jgi:hypothetical protein
MIEFLQSFYYNHPWSHVVIGMWHKYPNPSCSHVTSVDVLDRTFDPKTGLVRTERIIGCKQNAPAWVIKLFGGSEQAFVREISFIDAANQTATITSTNLSLSQVATCNEQIHYSPASHDRTMFTQSAEISARMSWRTAADSLEKWLLQRFQQNAQLGKAGFSDVLVRLWEERQQLAACAS